MGRRIALLVSGASGMALPRTLLGSLAAHEEVERVHLVVSRGASQVLHHELGAHRTGAADLVEAAELTPEAAAKVVTHRNNELDAPIASGSYPLSGAAIVPCSAGSLGALATGAATTLVHRAAAVALKESWPLVIGFRETPFTAIHLENMRRLAYAGATIMPPVPAFYIGGGDLDRFLAHFAMRVMDRFGLRSAGDPDLRWGDSEA